MSFQPFPFVNPDPFINNLLDDPFEDNDGCHHKCRKFRDHGCFQPILLTEIDPVSLDPEPTPLDLSPIFETPGLSSAGPSVIFGPPGYYLVQLKLPLSTSCHVGQSIFFVTPVVTGNLTISPANYISPPLCCELDHVVQVYYFLISVLTSGASVLFNVNLNTTAPCGQVCLGHGRLLAYRLPD